MFSHSEFHLCTHTKNARWLRRILRSCHHHTQECPRAVCCAVTLAVPGLLPLKGKVVRQFGRTAVFPFLHS